MHLFRLFLKVSWQVAVAALPGGLIIVVWHNREKIRLLMVHARRAMRSRLRDEKRNEAGL